MKDSSIGFGLVNTKTMLSFVWLFAFHSCFLQHSSTLVSFSGIRSGSDWP